MNGEALLLSGAFLVTALLYAAVGQAGASGYIAIMGLAGFGPLAMKTTALSLNLLVAAIGTALFLRAGRLSWQNVWPFAVLGFPFSLLGGAIHLPEGIYFPVVGAVLILSALQMARAAILSPGVGPAVVGRPPFAAALATGAVIGFVSGTTGTGGGVFLAPIIPDDEVGIGAANGSHDSSLQPHQLLCGPAWDLRRLGPGSLGASRLAGRRRCRWDHRRLYREPLSV